MRDFSNGFFAQAKTLFTTPKHLIMLALLIFMSVVTAEVYRGMVLRDVPVAILDLDQSSLSRTLVRMVDATREVRVVHPPISSVEEAQQWLLRGEGAAVMLIPSKFSSDLKHGREPRILIAIDGSNIVLAKNVNKALATAVATVSAGAQLTFVRKLGLSESQAMAAVQPIAIDINDSFNPANNYAVYIVPGSVFFLLHVYAMLLFASVFLPESASPSRSHRVGRLGAIAVVTLLLGIAFFLILMPIAQVSLQSNATVAICVLGAFLVVEALFAAALAKALPGPLFAFQVTVILTMLALMLSGITWPIDRFPEPLQQFSSFLPFTPFARALRIFVHEPVGLDQLRLPLRQLAQQAGVFAAITLVATLSRAFIARFREVA
ncbi:MAG TPA: ABC transporter permease [Polyangiaceae bacterium]|jgi:ABC-2 type transport system permease protein|nr:MAG: ABC-2 family transporter protein [Deltaproteobacteria bacterium ADurb.Bin207]HNS95832.1 ABC transporter permease [Polyangiaceae bacterium]HNZ21471.1 ABC transporter permease [Polyangiaceae bacterium]HOD23650.1 ABC transporter permease [Polyangiaceae bacterium]HOE50050.1 ABC transporter permease [Polyangiaceae bacterium]